MREICLYGSEGGETEVFPIKYSVNKNLSCYVVKTNNFSYPRSNKVCYNTLSLSPIKRLGISNSNRLLRLFFPKLCLLPSTSARSQILPYLPYRGDCTQKEFSLLLCLSEYK